MKKILFIVLFVPAWLFAMENPSMPTPGAEFAAQRFMKYDPNNEHLTSGKFTEIFSNYMKPTHLLFGTTRIVTQQKQLRWKKAIIGYGLSRKTDLSNKTQMDFIFHTIALSKKSYSSEPKKPHRIFHSLNVQYPSLASYSFIISEEDLSILQAIPTIANLMHPNTSQFIMPWPPGIQYITPKTSGYFSLANNSFKDTNDFLRNDPTIKNPIPGFEYQFAVIVSALYNHKLNNSTVRGQADE